MSGRVKRTKPDSKGAVFLLLPPDQNPYAPCANLPGGNRRISGALRGGKRAGALYLLGPWAADIPANPYHRALYPGGCSSGLAASGCAPSGLISLVGVSPGLVVGGTSPVLGATASGCSCPIPGRSGPRPPILKTPIASSTAMSASSTAMSTRKTNMSRNTACKPACWNTTAISMTFAPSYAFVCFLVPEPGSPQHYAA